jgi:cation transport ATPase
MITSNKTPESISELKRRRTANKNTIISMALLFVALLSGSSATRVSTEELSSGDIIWGGLSIIAFATLLWSLFIAYKQADERQQLIQLKATSMTFTIVILGIITAQILHALSIVRLNTSVQFIVIGGIVLWWSLMKAVERRGK